MAGNKLNSPQIITKDSLEQLYRSSEYFSNDTDNIPLDNLLRSINSELTPPLRLQERVPVDLTVEILSISVQNPETDLTRTIPPISNLLPAFSSGTVTFPASSGGNATPSVGSTIVITVSSGNYLKVGINLNSSGELVLQAGTQGASAAAATVPPLVANTFPIGYVLLQNVGGTIQNITNASVFQYVGGGGGGGSGTGDASSLISRLWDKFQDSVYTQFTGVDFSSDEDAHVAGGSTGAYSSLTGTFDFANSSETLVTTQLLSADEFLDQEKKVEKVSLTVIWDEDAVDDAATYEISRDSGNEYQPITMERVGLASDTYEGELDFAEEASFLDFYFQTTNDTSFDLNATTQQKIAQSFVSLAGSGVIKQLDLSLTKTGSPSGNLYISIHRDASGDPGEILVESSAIPVSGLSTGSNILDIPAVAIDSTSTYWVVIRTDADYKTSYSDGVAEISLQAYTGGTGLSLNDGATWTPSSDELKLRVKGSPLEVRVRITSSQGDVSIKGFGLFYEPTAGIISGIKNVQTEEFLSNTDNENEFTLTFLPEPDLLRVYHIQSGQVYVYPGFTISGNVVTFPVDTFQQESDETVTLKFVQTEGSSFDNSDQNANDIADHESRIQSLEEMVPGSSVHLYTGNGYGSSSTKIRRFTSSSVTGTGISYPGDSATLGAELTIVEDGIYAMNYIDGRGSSNAGSHSGISLNASSLTTNIQGLALTEILALDSAFTATEYLNASAVWRLSAGDVIRPHGNGNANENAIAQFRITQILKL